MHRSCTQIHKVVSLQASLRLTLRIASAKHASHLSASSLHLLQPQHRNLIYSIELPNLAEQSRHNGNRSSSPRLLRCALLRSRRRILRPHEIRTQEYLSIPFRFPFPFPFPPLCPSPPTFPSLPFPSPTALAQPPPS